MRVHISIYSPKSLVAKNGLIKLDEIIHIYTSQVTPQALGLTDEFNLGRKIDFGISV